MQIKRFMGSELAGSEALDFAILLGIMILTLGLIAVLGYPMLASMQEASHMENVKQSFRVLSLDANKVVLGKVPSTSAELKIYGESLSVTDEARIKITMNIWNTSLSGFENITFKNETIQVGSIENKLGSTSIAYEGTGTWVKYSEDSGMLEKPLITNTSHALIIPIVVINGRSTVSGKGVARAVIEGNYNVPYVYNNVSNITIEIASPYYKGWESFFNKELNWEVISSSNGTLVARYLPTKNIDVYIVYSQVGASII